MKPEPHLVVGDSFADGAGASAAGDFDLAAQPNRCSVYLAMRMGRPLCWPRSQKWPYFSYPPHSSFLRLACDAVAREPNSEITVDYLQLSLRYLLDDEP